MRWAALEFGLNVNYRYAFKEKQHKPATLIRSIRFPNINLWTKIMIKIQSKSIFFVSQLNHKVQWRIFLLLSNKTIWSNSFTSLIKYLNSPPHPIVPLNPELSKRKAAGKVFLFTLETLWTFRTRVWIFA